MSTYSYNEILSWIEGLPHADQLRLLEDIAAMIRQQDLLRPLQSFLELEGLGQEIWEGIDAQEYVNQERASWNGYPRYEGK